MENYFSLMNKFLFLSDLINFLREDTCRRSLIFSMTFILANAPFAKASSPSGEEHVSTIGGDFIVISKTVGQPFLTNAFLRNTLRHTFDHKATTTESRASRITKMAVPSSTVEQPSGRKESTGVREILRPNPSNRSGAVL